MKVTIETLNLPRKIKNKLKMQVSTTNLNIRYFSWHIIQFNRTNSNLEKLFKIIVRISKNLVTL